MKIIIIGCGKVGRTLTEQLATEAHNITVIDTNPKKIQEVTEDLDVLGITGNGASISTLQEAGVEQADILISVTGSDELNLLCCLIAKKAQPVPDSGQSEKPHVQPGDRFYQSADGRFHDHQSRACDCP